MPHCFHLIPCSYNLDKIGCPGNNLHLFSQQEHDRVPKRLDLAMGFQKDSSRRRAPIISCNPSHCWS